MNLLTVDQLAEALQISKNTIYYWVSRGEIPHIKMGKRLRFQLPEVIEHFRSKHASKACCINWDKYINSDCSLKIESRDSADHTVRR